MKNLSGQESLWIVFPILIVLILLIGGIIFLPTTQTEIRGRASEPIPAVVTPTDLSETPEIICSDLYDPVCGIDNKTYANDCEANLAGIISFTPGMCESDTQIPDSTGLSSPELQYTLPATN